jgi:hypothetical protein
MKSKKLMPPMPTLKAALTIILMMPAASAADVPVSKSVARHETGAGIEKAVAGLENGWVRLSLAARDGVCGDGEDCIWLNGSKICWRCRDDDLDDGEVNRDDGPVRVTLKVQGGVVVRIKTRVGGSWRERRGEVIDLGDVPSRAAADYLLSLVRSSPGQVAKEAILPAALARDVEIWPDLLAVARSRSRPEDVRESAVFWLSQFAGAKATEHLARLVDDDDVDLKVREAAVFALSQRPGRDCTRHLMKIARTSDHPQLRRNAMFWLAQQDDPAVLDFFEKILLEN